MRIFMIAFPSIHIFFGKNFLYQWVREGLIKLITTCSLYVSTCTHRYAATDIDTDTHNCIRTRTDTVAEDHLRLPAHAKYTGVLDAASPFNSNLLTLHFCLYLHLLLLPGQPSSAQEEAMPAMWLLFALFSFLLYLVGLKNAKEQFKILDIFVNSLIYLYMLLLCMQEFQKEYPP